MKQPFYQILELYEDAVITHGQWDLSSTERACLKLASILYRFSETKDQNTRAWLHDEADKAWEDMNHAVSEYREAREKDVKITLHSDLEWLERWDYSNRMADIREEYKR